MATQLQRIEKLEGMHKGSESGSEPESPYKSPLHVAARLDALLEEIRARHPPGAQGVPTLSKDTQPEWDHFQARVEANYQKRAALITPELIAAARPLVVAPRWAPRGDFDSRTFLEAQLKRTAIKGEAA